MKQLTMEEVLDQAIAREQESYELYEKLSLRVDDAASRDTLHFMAAEELKHKAMLQKCKKGEMGSDAISLCDAADARVVEALGAPDMSGPIRHKDIFLFAAGREKAAHEFYLRMAELQPPGELQSILSSCAAEELRHKDKVEYLYCNAAFVQTDGG